MLIVHMTEKSRCAPDQQKVIGVKLIDFRKAFDCLTLNLLINKKKKIGIMGDCWMWLNDYIKLIKDRSQCTTQGKATSDPEHVTSPEHVTPEHVTPEHVTSEHVCGVSQRSVPGPILSSLHTNDLPDNS